MADRTKPTACCEPRQVKPLPKRKRDRLAAVAKALADPGRIEILSLLAQQTAPVCACDIVAHLELSQPTVSHHLKTLKDAGLIRAGRSGLWAFYEIDRHAARATESLTDLLRRN